ncbi:MAG: ribosome small subunit-dependent GTPase A [bacterium]
MAKRRLSDHQKRRIMAQQKQTPGNRDGGLSGSMTGRVIARYGKTAEVRPENDANSTYFCHIRANVSAIGHEASRHASEVVSGSIVTGDYVQFTAPETAEADNHQERPGLIASVKPRYSSLIRSGFRRKPKLIAANIDLVAIVFAPIPEFFTTLIDRYLAASTLQGLQPLLILNKTDLIPEAQRSDLPNIVQLYSSLGYTIIQTSAKNRDGIDRLESELAGKTAVFVGQSGTGKSSLMKAMIPEFSDEIGALSSAKNKGRHTTTTSRLYESAHGAALIDSPGIREFELWDIDTKKLPEGFPEIRKFAAECQFRDCAHLSEPGCRVREALDNGEIAASRFDSFQQIRSG